MKKSHALIWAVLLTIFSINFITTIIGLYDIFWGSLIGYEVALFLLVIFIGAISITGFIHAALLIYYFFSKIKLNANSLKSKSKPNRWSIFWSVWNFGIGLFLNLVLIILFVVLLLEDELLRYYNILAIEVCILCIGFGGSLIFSSIRVFLRKIKGKKIYRPLPGLKTITIIFLFSLPTFGVYYIFGVYLPEHGTPPIYYIGNEKSDPNFHDGRLRPVIGVQLIEVMRANRIHPEWSDMVGPTGWTYNHAPMLCYWNNTFYFQYLSNEFKEHEAPGRTMILSSTDGFNWSTPRIAFPEYKIIGNEYAVHHQRMGFYVAPNGRLLTLAFLGVEPSVQDGNGVGRIVREIYTNGSLGPIYFIRVNQKWTGDLGYPLYSESNDSGFIEACEGILNDKVRRLQWYEEDRSLDGFYTCPGPVREAFSFYTREDGTIVGLFKHEYACTTTDNGTTWTYSVKCPSFIMGGAKQWGQHTDDGKYAIVYNPDENNRWPLAVVTSSDGIYFDNLSVICGEVEPQRFTGRWKDVGPQYVRGIVEGNGNPPGNDLWLCFSMNKEDMWIAKVPLQINWEEESNLNETFDNYPIGGSVDNWNIWSGKWSSVEVAEYPSSTNKSLKFMDQDPYDYAKAFRVFPYMNTTGVVNFQFLAEQNNTGKFNIEIVSRFGKRPVRIKFDNDGWIKANSNNILQYYPNSWYNLTVYLDITNQQYNFSINGSLVSSNLSFAESTSNIERIEFQTGDYRLNNTPMEIQEDLANPDEPVSQAVFYIDNVITS